VQVLADSVGAAGRKEALRLELLGLGQQALVRLTWRPALASDWAMPPPMYPAPTWATLLISTSTRPFSLKQGQATLTTRRRAGPVFGLPHRRMCAARP
jgi:hypothetical protein